MVKTPIINDFRAGELTPITDARVDLKDYYRGCRVLENAMPIIEGGVARVPGTYYVRPVKTDEGWNIRVTKSGNGTGVVTSDVAGINCGASCYVFFVDGITVILTATPDSGMSFTAWSGDGTGLVTRSVLMDGNKVINAEFSSADPYLIGWYKFDEGSGLVVHNYAEGGSLGGGLLPDLAVVQNVGQFWTYRPGFGTTLQHVFGAGNGLIDFAWAYPNKGQIGPSGFCFGIFVRSKVNPYGDTGDYGGYLCCSNQSLSSGIGFILEHQHIYYNYQNQEKYGMSIIKTTYSAQWYNVWTFHFVDKDEGKYRIVKPDGTLWSSSATFDISLMKNIWCNYLMSGCSGLDANPATKGLYPGGGSYGDWIIYSNKILTLAEWAVWYDLLRSRYGMAARSGW